MIASHSQVANPILVAKSHENVDISANSVTNREAHIDSTEPTKSCSPPLPQVSLIAMPGIEGFLIKTDRPCNLGEKALASNITPTLSDGSYTAAKDKLI